MGKLLRLLGCAFLAGIAGWATAQIPNYGLVGGIITGFVLFIIIGAMAITN